MQVSPELIAHFKAWVYEGPVSILPTHQTSGIRVARIQGTCFNRQKWLYILLSATVALQSLCISYFVVSTKQQNNNANGNIIGKSSFELH